MSELLEALKYLQRQKAEELKKEAERRAYFERLGVVSSTHKLKADEYIEDSGYDDI